MKRFSLIAVLLLPVLASAQTTRDTVPMGTTVLNQTAASNTSIGSSAGTFGPALRGVAVGFQAAAGASGDNNTAVGAQTLVGNTGGGNTAVGSNALSGRNAGSEDTALGFLALARNTAKRNTAVGSRVMQFNTTGFDNTGIGWSALSGNTTGSLNTALGYEADSYPSAASSTTAVGAEAGSWITFGNYNTAVGTYSLTNAVTGASNTSVGHRAASLTVNGNSNVVVGDEALNENITGNQNTAVGTRALRDLGSDHGVISNVSGNGSTGVTIVTPNSLSSGNQVAITGTVNWNGIYSVVSATSTRFVATAISTQLVSPLIFPAETSGYWALATTVGNNNTVVGYSTGRGIVTGSGNTILGANVTGLPSGLTNNIVLADGTGTIRAQFDGTNWTLYGGATRGNGGSKQYIEANGAATLAPIMGTSSYAGTGSLLATFWNSSSAANTQFNIFSWALGVTGLQARNLSGGAASTLALNPSGGPVTVQNGSNVLYRCTVAGALRVGQLTTVSTDCGKAVDTGMRVN